VFAWGKKCEKADESKRNECVTKRYKENKRARRNKKRSNIKRRTRKRD
jgi:hypothetical protein